MKSIVLASGLVLVLAGGPAFAANNTTSANQRHQHPAAHAESHAQMLKDPYGVYIGGQEIARDPDPNIRDELGREFYWGG